MIVVKVALPPQSTLYDSCEGNFTPLKVPFMIVVKVTLLPQSTLYDSYEGSFTSYNLILWY